MKTHIVPLKADFSFDLAAMQAADCAGYYLCNPNAPTGIALPLSTVENFVASVGERIVIADEAYMDFYGQSAVPLTKKYKNLLVVKTFSKSYSLAGIRCGYAVGDEALIGGLFRMKDCFNSYPVDAVAQAVCTAAVEDKDYRDKTAALVKKERARLREALLSLGFTVPESGANFLFAGRAKKTPRSAAFPRLHRARIGRQLPLCGKGKEKRRRTLPRPERGGGPRALLGKTHPPRFCAHHDRHARTKRRAACKAQTDLNIGSSPYAAHFCVRTKEKRALGRRKRPK